MTPTRWTLERLTGLLLKANIDPATGRPLPRPFRTVPLRLLPASHSYSAALSNVYRAAAR